VTLRASRRRRALTSRLGSGEILRPTLDWDMRENAEGSVLHWIHKEITT
jgi:hypothetical protein